MDGWSPWSKDLVRQHTISTGRHRRRRQLATSLTSNFNIHEILVGSRTPACRWSAWSLDPVPEFFGKGSRSAKTSAADEAVAVAAISGGAVLAAAAATQRRTVCST